MAKTRNNKDAPPTFEESMIELEAIIERIESGEAGLEQSLTQYERGMKLIGNCRAILAAAEQKIAELNVDAKGRLRLEEAAADGEERPVPESDEPRP